MEYHTKTIHSEIFRVFWVQTGQSSITGDIAHTFKNTHAWAKFKNYKTSEHWDRLKRNVFESTFF